MSRDTCDWTQQSNSGGQFQDMDASLHNVFDLHRPETQTPEINFEWFKRPDWNMFDILSLVYQGEFQWNVSKRVILLVGLSGDICHTPEPVAGWNSAPKELPGVIVCAIECFKHTTVVVVIIVIIIV